MPPSLRLHKGDINAALRRGRARRQIRSAVNAAIPARQAGRRSRRARARAAGDIRSHAGSVDLLGARRRAGIDRNR
jgi:hypothetical protein